MAATSAAFAAATGSTTTMAFSGRTNPASRLSSGNAFGATSMVQFAPLRILKKSVRLVSTSATLSEDPKAIRRNAIVSILAAGAVLGFSVSVVEASIANPIDVAKSKTATTLKSAQDAAPSLPSAPSPGGGIESAQKGAENIASDFKGRIDGIFGKGKGPFGKVTSTGSSKSGSAIGDAAKRFSEFGTNPIAKNIEESSKNAEKTIASAKTQKPESQRVAEATTKVENLGSDFQNKGRNAISGGKTLLNEKTQGSVPNFPNLFPKDAPSLPALDTIPDLKSGLQSKVEDAKSTAGSAIQ